VLREGLASAGPSRCPGPGLGSGHVGPVAIPISKQDIEEIEEIMWRDAPDLIVRDDMRETPEWRWRGAGSRR
jgi:hypothetical protein